MSFLAGFILSLAFVVIAGFFAATWFIGLKGNPKGMKYSSFALLMFGVLTIVVSYTTPGISSDLLRDLKIARFVFLVLASLQYYTYLRQIRKK